MRAYKPILMAVAAVFLQDGVDAQACGDKFLLLGRGVKFQRAYAAIYPASIVIYAQPQRSAAKAIRDPRLQSDRPTVLGRTGPVRDRARRADREAGGQDRGTPRAAHSTHRRLERRDA